jgi:cytochrome c-type biogenesis protein CcmH/NrfF
MSRPWTRRALELTFVVVFAVAALGAVDSSARFEKDNHAMICMCGCNQLLGECNHVGCPSSPVMLAQLQAGIARGDSDNTIFRAFQQQYGPIVLASPMFTPFNHLAWIVPPVVFFLGIGGAMLIIGKWKLHTVPLPPPAPGIAGDSEIRDRIRRETQL